MFSLIQSLCTSTPTLTETLEQHYLPYARVAPATVDRYRCELRRWIRFVGDMQLHRVTEEHFAAFRNACLARRLSNSSTEGSVKIVKALLRFAKDRGWIKSLPIFGKPLPLEEPEPEPATIEELSRLYRAADVARFPARGSVSPAAWMRAFIALEYWTGIRGQDLISRFAWQHVREDHIRFRASKTAKRHTFPLCDVVVQHLRLVHGMDERHVFDTQSLQRVNAELERMCDSAGIRKLTTGHIREACFTQWTLAGETAGKLVHGCGLPRVFRRHYLGRLQILNDAAERFAWFDVG